MLTLPEAAKALGIAASTLRLQIRLGKFNAVKWGKQWMVEPQEVERYRQQHLRGAAK